MSAQLLIHNGSKTLEPAVHEDIKWTTERFGSPGKLVFKVHIDNALDIKEGNVVEFRWNGNKIFYGFIFTKQRDREPTYTITAYDQLRYLKNKETYVYENKTASDVIQMICDDFRMQTGSLENTGYRIASRVEDSQTLYDIIGNALDLTLVNTKYMYILFDDYGKVTLKGIDNMTVNILIDEATGQNFDYQSSIDEATYNKIKLIYDNEETGQRDVYIAQDSNHMNEWGVLQFYDSLSKGENGQAKVNALLELYNQKTRKLTIKEAFGDYRVRAGSLVGVIMNLGDVKLQNNMLVETCEHTFKLDEHTMTLKLRGGEFVA